MREAIAAIQRLCQGRSFEDYASDEDLVAAVERYVERRSEASRHTPEDWKARFAEIDWRGLADVGNVLRHVYDQVVDEEIWEAVTTDLAPIGAAVDEMLKTAAAHDREEVRDTPVRKD